MKLLVADGDTALIETSSYIFGREGFNVMAATDGSEALDRCVEERPDLILLELSLPRINGLEVLRRIRAAESSVASTPVIVVTDRTGEDDIISGFAAGADDYVFKPFSHRQLTARIRAVLRRQGAAAEPTLEIKAAGLVLDCQAHEVWREASPEHRLHLTPIEFRLLRIMAENVGRVVRSVRMVEYAWGLEGGDATLLKTHMSHLRAKLKLGGRDPDAPAEITVLSTVGYSLKALK